jgi:hypothetical protein
MRADENAGPRYRRMHAHAHRRAGASEGRATTKHQHPHGHAHLDEWAPDKIDELEIELRRVNLFHRKHLQSPRLAPSLQACVLSRESTPTVSRTTHLIKARYAKESISSHHFPHGVTPLDDVVAGATFDDGKLILCSHALQEQPRAWFVGLLPTLPTWGWRSP